MRPLLRACVLAMLLGVIGPAVQASSLLSEAVVRKGIYNVLDHQPVKHAECKNYKPTGPIETTLCDYETVESVTEELYSNLSELVRLPFFKYFQVDLYRDCPFWNEYGSCMDPGCAITTVDESDVPEKWRSTTLSKLESSSIGKRHELPGCYYRDSDFCFLDDHTEGDYFDLSLVPERFTGYSGPGAHRIWRSIYEENCFGLSELNLMAGNSPAPVSLPDSMSEVFSGEGKGIDHSEHCLEKRVYYKIISGLHASISTHICLEYLNRTTGQWAPNLECFIERVASHPERLQYMYFNTVLLLRAVSRLGPYLSVYDYCSTGTHEDDQETLSRISKVVNIAQNVGRFDETVLFRGENANVLKEEFKTHFRNVSRIMDCVGCDKCRLWGKVQITGLATAMKILFELDEKALDPYSNANLLQRSEVVALMNTLYRFVESLTAVNQFRAMWSAMGPADSEDLIVKTEQHVVSKPRPSPHVGNEPVINVFEEAQLRLTSLLRVCKNGTMSCLDEQEQRRSKQLQDSFSGLTLRYPEKAAVRSESPLPDYETSEARQKLIAKEYSRYKGIDPRLWRAILYAFIIYVVLSLVIGLPIILVKKRQHDTSLDFPPPMWDGDPDFGTSMTISNSDTWLLGDTAKCEWDEVTVHSAPTCSAKVERTLDYSGSFYIRSNISTVASNTTYSNGQLTVNINPDTSASKLVFKVDVTASSEDLLHQTMACFDGSGNDKGLFVFVSTELKNTDFVTVNIQVLLPSTGPSTPLDNFITYLPWFSQNFGDLSSHLLVRNLIIEGAGYDVVAESVNASKISVRNSYASIVGAFHASATMSLDSVKGNINTNITLEHLPTAIGPTSLVLDTGDGAIDARVLLVAPQSRRLLPHPSPYLFVADVKTFNGPLRFQAANSNSTHSAPLQLTVQNTDGKTDVYLDKDYEGTYSAQSKLGKVTVIRPNLPSSMDPLAQKRPRLYISDQQSNNQVAGWVGWGKRPAYGLGVPQGQIKITTSLSPILLQLGSGTD
ncbi:putative endoplasmic Reticulum Oxidoreductin 1 (ERO1) [Lyophyllum shimeji]|uniref:Endoplasmic Reticulum Oxidoreductin 1 (ERO1) n=1 Tax=Lyophyllum shimeji TaxID=47721 RepID=A0A9P3ULS1_LYOSH|nr:putative endoplasmic Reticulum Oxidoreductin 1 (ERO1) [Lyophyllum shimeji]